MWSLDPKKSKIFFNSENKKWFLESLERRKFESFYEKSYNVKLYVNAWQWKTTMLHWSLTWAFQTSESSFGHLPRWGSSSCLWTQVPSGTPLLVQPRLRCDVCLTTSALVAAPFPSHKLSAHYLTQQARWCASGPTWWFLVWTFPRTLPADCSRAHCPFPALCVIGRCLLEGGRSEWSNERLKICGSPGAGGPPRQCGPRRKRHRSLFL